MNKICGEYSEPGKIDREGDKYVCCHPYYLMLSPLLFNIYLDEFVREGSEGRDEGQKKLDLDLLPIDFDFWLSAFE